ncbi:pancreatic triacylglycerol lipase-like [Thrips palmi]|uniref:Pancreatic triacylglycerol lipase-like n=1 Tax=Thrips palmi TaxID=161013 RepID=A0A6P8Z746_THRPL|nr:pancreatic triacylglycerol lipase-like [Thrips palmi]
MKSTLFCLCVAVLVASALGGKNPNLEIRLDSVLNSTGKALTSDDFSEIQFTLYTNTRNTSYPIAEANALLADPAFDAGKPTALYMHGWSESNDSESVGAVSRAFLRRGSHNFVLLDWSEYVKGDYITSFVRCTAAGEAVGAAVNRMVDAGLDRDTFWPIGHSLGGQLSGVMAKSLDFKPSRITALDPAGPGFNLPGIPSLTRDDAVVVDVIHTDAGVSGSSSNDATIDFWPNGGTRPQPGCNVGETKLAEALLYCGHRRSWEFFAESVNDETAFPAVSCRSWSAFKKGLCPANDSNVVYMGFPAPGAYLTGTFYLRTGPEEPFGLGVDGARPDSGENLDATTTTDASVTDAPTTVWATTEAPTTEWPSTEVPITEAPTTSNAPITNAPTTNAPITNAPITNAPITNAPITNAPITNAPITNAPITNAPITNAPITNAPTTNANSVVSQCAAEAASNGLARWLTVIVCGSPSESQTSA